jgi:ketosteroid isomerase-like protein
MGEHPNVALVREAFRHIANGDLGRMAECWDDNISYYAFDASGHAAEYNGREEAMDIVRAGQQLVKEHTYELVDLRAVGSELVIVQAKVHLVAANAKDAVDTDFVGVFRVKGGKIVSGCDFIDSTTEHLLDSAWS